MKNFVAFLVKGIINWWVVVVPLHGPSDILIIYIKKFCISIPFQVGRGGIVRDPLVHQEVMFAWILIAYPTTPLKLYAVILNIALKSL